MENYVILLIGMRFKDNILQVSTAPTIVQARTEEQAWIKGHEIGKQAFPKDEWGKFSILVSHIKNVHVVKTGESND